jgi:MATE family multidrug resistance protein
LGKEAFFKGLIKTMIIKNSLDYVGERWAAEGGYRQALNIAIPLIFSSAGMAIQQFINRMFLAWYSPEAIAASMPAGLINFTFLNLFIGTAGYVSIFVAQYWGAQLHDRIGPILWQGFYVAIIAALVNLLFVPLAGPFFKMIGHPPEVQRLEIIYFQILCFSAGPVVANAVMAGFFVGRGKPLPVMAVGITVNTVNIFLNYCWIFGALGFPEMGIRGAALAVLTSNLLSLFLLSLFFFERGNNKRFRILSGWKPDGPLFSRLLRFGLPNGLQFFISFAGLSVFLLLIGRLGTMALAATNIAFNINLLAFMPMTGVGMAVMTLVGQYQGKKRADLAEKSVYSCFHLTSLYMLTLALLYVIIPELFLWPFSVRSDPGSFAQIQKVVIVLLRFVAIYSLFDGLNIVFSSGVKGAGDTRFVLMMIIGLSLFGLALPSYMVMVTFRLGLMAAWTVMTVYVILLSFAFLLRFGSGKWKTMLVIDTKDKVKSKSVL